MSTRCQIRIIQDGYILNMYHHCDGYFEGVGKELHDFLKKSTDDAFNIVKSMQEDVQYEITFGLHGDIEYFYLINFDIKEFFGWQTSWPEIWNVSKNDKNWFAATPNVIEESKIDLLDDNLDCFKEE